MQTNINGKTGKDFGLKFRLRFYIIFCFIAYIICRRRKLLLTLQSNGERRKRIKIERTHRLNLFATLNPLQAAIFRRSTWRVSLLLDSRLASEGLALYLCTNITVNGNQTVSVTLTAQLVNRKSYLQFYVQQYRRFVCFSSVSLNRTPSTLYQILYEANADFLSSRFASDSEIYNIFYFHCPLLEIINNGIKFVHCFLHCMENLIIRLQ